MRYSITAFMLSVDFNLHAVLTKVFLLKGFLIEDFKRFEQTAMFNKI